MLADASTPDAPWNSAVTLPPLVALPLTMPMPMPTDAASEYPSTCESPSERAITFSAPVVDTTVPDPTAARTVGELIANASAPDTRAEAAMPRRARHGANAGATTVG